MSKLLVEMHNYTDKLIDLGSRASGKPARGLPVPPGALGKGKHTLNWEIPDNSDSSKYFDTNHTTINIIDPETRKTLKTFSFWDDDWKNFGIFYCEGTDWKNTTQPMRGGNKGKDGSKIVLHISEHPPKSGNYELTAVVLTDADLTRAVLDAFQYFRTRPEVNLRPEGKYTPQEIRTMMDHPTFQSVIDAAAESQCKSVAVIIGGGGSIAVGAEGYVGVLIGIEPREVYFLRCVALAIGFDFGAEAFVGVYMSNAVPLNVAGVEFFIEVAGGYGPGIALIQSVSWGATSYARSILITGGIDVAFGLGVGQSEVLQ